MLLTDLNARNLFFIYKTTLSLHTMKPIKMPLIKKPRTPITRSGKRIPPSVSAYLILSSELLTSDGHSFDRVANNKK